jgi:hypothetical protein
LVHVGKHINEMFNKGGVRRLDVFQLSKTEDIIGFTNVSKIVPASNDEEEEVLLETQNIQDYKHLTEVGEVMGKDNKTQ